MAKARRGLGKKYNDKSGRDGWLAVSSGFLESIWQKGSRTQ
ncbi:MAG: hypothetical protein OP8BY_1485 [Candidatus Saccharicenans subterraneus]|uniref:Uncharacterized protein n=1 Tax=Candidatus Saccharicenans subterraneus TaxID=2508984 RepID=A0A3E2BJR7_9BACT|nr:MAG: hypothetical protein OP8BY_1485 [Candidatus Saccharicenans subterraneum]